MLEVFEVLRTNVPRRSRRKVLPHRLLFEQRETFWFVHVVHNAHLSLSYLPCVNFHLLCLFLSPIPTGRYGSGYVQRK